MRRIERGAADNEGQYCGLLFGIDVKQGYSFLNHELSMSGLNDFARQCSDLAKYGNTIAKSIDHGTVLNALMKSEAPKFLSLTSVQKPVWLKQLKRNREDMIK